MEKNRLEAFSDGVLAIIITIMVLELKVPHSAELAALAPLWPTVASYVLSFIYVGIYWNNHHHMFQASRSVDASVLWSNLHLLFWLSLLPFATGWMGENHFARWPTVCYGVDLFACASAYHILQTRLVRHHGAESRLAQVIGRDMKGKASVVLYAFGIALAAADFPRVGALLYVAVALMWFIPDRRMERAIRARES